MFRVQHGVLSLRQAERAGFDRSTINRRVRAGRYDRVLPGVICPAGAPLTPRSRIMAAVLWAGDGAAASFSAAANLLGLPGYSRHQIEVSTAARGELHGSSFSDGQPVVVHRVDDRLLPEIEVLDGIPATSARRTLIDLAGRKDPRVEVALDAARKNGQTTIGDIWLLLEKEWMRGRRGVRIMRNLLVARTSDMAPTESELEVRMLRLLRKMGFPDPIPQYPVTLPDGSRIRIDFAYPEVGLAIETDGYSYHFDGVRFETDRMRDNELRIMGWTPLRFTWAALRYDRARVERVLDAIRKRFFP